jgi:hypothetical protein
VNFLPLGAGQFQNKQRAKGYAFFTGQLVTLSASLSIYFYLANKYEGGTVPLADGLTVRRLQQIQIGAGGAFWALWAWSVVDSLVHYQPRAQIQGDDTLLPPDLQKIDKRRKTPKKTSLLDRLRLGPMVTPDSVGIGIGLED